jgi:diamine N-acetyltransferase
MNELNIRQANFEDANLLVVLASVTFYEAYFETDDQKDIANYIVRKYSLEQIETELADKNSTFFIVEINGKAVGFAKLRENSKPECLKDENSIELHRIYLIERVWRKGIGRDLIEKCLSEAKRNGYESMWLGTWEENVKAQKFYAKLGFTKVGEFQYDYESKIATNFILVKKV